MADERTTLMMFVNYLRAVLARKATGITDEQARTVTCPPSNLTIFGLIRHLAAVERGWAQRSMLGADVPSLFAGESGDACSGDVFHPPPDATLADALATYWAEIEAADAVYAAARLDDIERGGQRMYSLRWILVHLVEEYARHCGHADLIREAIDGATGD